MQQTYSIAEARNQFATLIRQAENNVNPVQVMRHGKPVAIILSVAAYEQMQQKQVTVNNFVTELDKFREKWGVDRWDESVDPWENVRDRAVGREDNPWL